ncbi:MAG: RNA polymerase-binding protein DksA [Coxiellaceae bacterium]|nr:RNA polymerase-binding protein DksA [Coxiellaceae bacterium]
MVFSTQFSSNIGPIIGPVNIKSYQSKKNERYMNAKQLEHFREVLLRWKNQLMTKVDHTVHHMQERVFNYPDPVDRASQEEEFSLELRARDRERKLLRKIEEALNRINDNDYGYCDDCGAEIGIQRLEVRPTATQCIECKTIAEIRERQIGASSLFE